MDEEFVWKVPGMHVWRGIVCPTDMTPGICRWVEEDLKFNEGDVILQCYGDSKIKWIQEVIYLIHHLDDIEKTDRTELGYRVPFLDKHHRFIDPKDLVKDMKPLLGKTHLHGDVLGHHVAEGKVKVVMWFMDPRQVLVNYHHTMSTMACKMLGWEPVDWNTFHEAYKQHQMLEGDWFDFVRSWQPYFNCSNVLMLFYEDVAKDLVGTVKRIADFCGKNLSEDALSKIASCKPFDEPGRDPYKVFTPDQMKEFNVRFTSEMSGTEFEMRYPPK